MSHTCVICYKLFSNKWNLKAHLEIHDDTKYKCTYDGCDKLYSKMSNMRRHMLSHQSSNISNTYTCNICYKEFKLKQLLNVHMRIHFDDRRYICSHEGCNKSFIKSDHLKQHINTHTSQEVFVCNYNECNSEFNRKCNLDRHINNVHKRKREDDKTNVGKKIKV